MPIRQVCLNLPPQTNQSTSYDTGDDADYKAGFPGATRFFDQGDGTVYDAATHLYWVKQPELIVPTSSGQVLSAEGAWATATAYIVGDLVEYTGDYYVCLEAHTSGTFTTDIAAGKWVVSPWTGSAANLTTPATMTWTAALAACEALDYCGHTDWRMPNIMEMFALVDRSPVGNGQFFAVFVNTKATSTFQYFSSSTISATTSTYAACLQHYQGKVNPKLKTDSHYIRPVRGGVING